VDHLKYQNKKSKTTKRIMHSFKDWQAQQKIKT